MSHRNQHKVYCWAGSCTASHPGSKWDTIRADEQGWFHQKDGKAYCPKHVPEWVSKWRKQ